MKISNTSNNKMRALKIAVGGAVIIGLGVGKFILNVRPKKLETAKNVDLARFSGKWYEIARKPVTIERKSFKNITTHYSRVDENKLSVEWRYQTFEGQLGQLAGEAIVKDQQHHSLFKMSYLPEFLHNLRTKSYAIIRLDPDYKVALLGNKRRSHLWLLSRVPNLDRCILEDYLSFAEEQGFKLNDIIYVNHD